MSVSSVSNAAATYSQQTSATPRPTPLTTDENPNTDRPVDVVNEPSPSTVVTLSEAAKNPASQVDAEKFPGLAAYARGEKNITLTVEEGNEGVRLGIIKVGVDKSSMPLSEAWAPQLFVQAGGGKDLDLSHFVKQLNRAGVSDANAQIMFKTFDKSGDGSLSLDEYYAGIKSGGSQNTELFQRLIDTYTRNADGSVNDTATNQFLAQGLAVASRFWSRHNN
ncbi:EF-hand domain-containing protein [Pseudomonas sp.]|uniref:EF-hand domain-containing protein n=1 Tax=Pseudomonas sp. TaxID=306 RepID=UPI0032646741